MSTPRQVALITGVKDHDDAQVSELLFYLGNLAARRHWRRANDYVAKRWLAQQLQPEDFGLATGVQFSVRNSVEIAAANLGIRLRVEGQRKAVAQTEPETAAIEAAHDQRSVAQCLLIKSGVEPAPRG